MDIQLIMTILSLLGDIQIPPGAPAPQQIDAVYASWESTASVVYRCPDPTSNINPNGEQIVLAVGSSKCDASGCSSVAAAMPVMVYPKEMTCEKGYRIEHHKIFESMGEALEFRAGLPSEAKWTARPATEDQVVKWAMERRGWKILHYPGGDMYSYPDGVFEVYPANEQNFGEPLAQGKSALDAVARALKGSSRV